MDRHRLRTYLRALRLQSGLSQLELAALVGVHCDSISDYERERRGIPAKLIIAGELLFGLSAAELFPAFYRTIEDEISGNALGLYNTLLDMESEASAKKRKFLEDIPSRIKFDL
jgi:transcriptional regulator with XRE-family HTH domain